MENKLTITDALKNLIRELNRREEAYSKSKEGYSYLAASFGGRVAAYQEAIAMISEVLIAYEEGSIING